MRNYILVLSIALVSGILLSSCGNKERSIVGKWKEIDMTYDIKTSDKATTDRIMATLEVENDNTDSQNFFIEFTDDKKFISDGKETGIYTITDNKLSITDEKHGSRAIEFKISGDTLSLVYDASVMFNDKAKDVLGIDKDVKIEKATYTTTFISVK